MIRCPACAAWISNFDGECPHCRSTEFPEHSATHSADHRQQGETVDEPDNLQAIARFRHAAEAGFFLDELTRRLDITAEVVPKEQFDSLHASWSTDFVLMVPRPSALAAAQCLQELVEQTADESEAAETPAATAHPFSLFKSGTAWVPLALTFAAGAVSCWGFERLDRPRRGAAQPAGRAATARLLEEMGAVSGPWTQPVPGTKASRRVTFDRQARSVLWEEDRDGDGRFEIHRVFGAPD